MLNVQLEKVKSELNSLATRDDLRAVLVARGLSAGELYFVTGVIRTAVDLTLALARRAPAAAEPLAPLWSGDDPAARIETAYRTVLSVAEAVVSTAATPNAAVQSLGDQFSRTAARLITPMPGQYGALAQIAWTNDDVKFVMGSMNALRASAAAPASAPAAASAAAPPSPPPPPPASAPRSYRESGSEPQPAPPADVHLYEVWFGTNRQPLNSGNLSQGFANERDPDGRVYYGKCAVEVPRTHLFGSLGTPFWKRWLRLKFTDDYLKLRGIENLSGDQFFEQLREEVEALDQPAVLVYLHGYNTSFDDAALRAAQIGFDLKVPVTAFYSWPSMADLKGYPADIARVEASEEQIAAFLRDVADRTGAARVHVIAHSMGNRGFARAIAQITANAAANAGIRFGQIILAAPDVDVDLFRKLAAVYPKISERTTMYVSARDLALGMSSWLQDSHRAGFTPPITVVDGIDTVEVTNIDVSALGHGYFAEAEALLYDIKALLDENKAPSSRVRIEPATGPAKYWVIRA